MVTSKREWTWSSSSRSFPGSAEIAFPKTLVVALAIGVLAGCSSPRPAPVVDRAPPPPARPATAPPPAVARPAPVAPPITPQQPEAVVTAPLKGASGAVEAKPLGSGPTAAPATGPAPGISTDRMVTEPKGVRLPYSDQALAQLAQGSQAPRLDPKPEAARPDTNTARGPDDLDWIWPTSGKVIGTFNDATTKGVAISGRLGQPVVASAPGRVIFSGQGIRGFGKLIVIKHNNTYLSVYAHNNNLLVKEGQNVTKGQRIAEMGNTDTDQVKLHFEIRRFGKPIDPLKLLPPG